MDSLWLWLRRAVLFVFFAWASSGHAQSGDPLEKKVDSFAFDSLDEAIEKLQKATGFKVLCPRETTELMRKLWAKEKFPTASLSSRETVKRLLNSVCYDLGLAWKFNPQDSTVSVDLPWRAADPRAPADLLKFVMEQGRRPNLGKDEEWCQAFDALLCKPENLEKAAAVRQQVALSEFVRMPGDSRFMPREFLMRVPITSVSGQKYLGVFFNQPMVFSPGHGSVSYYWFKEDGTLAGAGLMNSGHRCTIIDSSIHQKVADGKREASEVHLILKFNNGGAPYIARFVLEDFGLRLIQLFDTFGETMDNSGYHVGESLLDRGK